MSNILQFIGVLLKPNMEKQRSIKCNQLKDLTKEDTLIAVEEKNKLCTPKQLAERVIAMLESGKGMFGGVKVDLYEHGLQTATRYN